MSATRPPSEPAPTARQARDAVAFGHEYGRVLTDGRIIGRAEPFAKVFPSSRGVKRAVGVTAWAVLEDIALDAQLDAEGRLVAETNVRRIAANLRLGKNTVHRHLARLREHGFVLHEEQRDDGSGRYETARYVLDPSACVERFTTTLPPHPEPSRPVARPPAAAPPTTPRPRSGDTARTVSPSTGHRERGPKNKKVVVTQEEQQQRLPADAVDRLLELGVARAQAERLVANHPAEQVERALVAIDEADQDGIRNVAGWIVAAIRESWEFADGPTSTRAATAGARSSPSLAASEEEIPQRRRREEGWRAVVASALGDDELASAIELASQPVPGLNRRSVPLVVADLVSWAVQVTGRQPARPIDDALLGALRSGDGRPQPIDPDEVELPAPPDIEPSTPTLEERVAALLDRCQRPANHCEVA